MPLLYATALTVAAAVPKEGTMRTTIELGRTGNAIQLLWDKKDISFYEVKQQAYAKAPAREGIAVLGTEVFTKGRWRVVAVGDNTPV